MKSKDSLINYLKNTFTDVLYFADSLGNLDSENSQLVFKLLIDLVKKKNVSALVATHNLDLIKKMDRVFCLTKNGFKEVK